MSPLMSDFTKTVTQVIDCTLSAEECLSLSKLSGKTLILEKKKSSVEYTYTLSEPFVFWGKKNKDDRNRDPDIYNTYTKYWDEAAILLSSFENNSTYSNFLQNLRHIIKDSHVLDIGAGDGRHLNLFFELGAEKTVGLDPSPVGLINHHRSVKKKSKDAFLYVIGDLFDTPIRQGYFDVTWCSGVINMLDQPSEALDKIATITKSHVFIEVIDERFLGSIYLTLNLIRPLCIKLHSLRLLSILLSICSFVLTVILTLANFMKKAPPEKSQIRTKKRHSFRQLFTIYKLKMLEPLISPKVQFIPPRKIIKILSKHGFELRDTNKFVFTTNYMFSKHKTLSNREGKN